MKKFIFINLAEHQTTPLFIDCEGIISIGPAIELITEYVKVIILSLIQVVVLFILVNDKRDYS